jgi:hypothetical protein
MSGARNLSRGDQPLRRFYESGVDRAPWLQFAMEAGILVE